MPVGPYATFDECVAAQIKEGYSETAARRICGAIERDSRQKYQQVERQDRDGDARKP